MNIYMCVTTELYSPFLLSTTLAKKGGQSPPLGAKNVKGVALKTHEGLRPSTLRAFEKARPKLLIVLGKCIS